MDQLIEGHVYLIIIMQEEVFFDPLQRLRIAS